MLDFTPLASSSSGCCYRLSGGSTAAPLLLDAGISFKQIRIGLNFQVSKLAACLLTHAHGDHAKGIRDLLFSGIDVYASKETIASLPREWAGNHRLKCVPPREEFKVGDWTVMPFEAVHDAPGTFGYLIGSPEGDRFLFLTDSAYSPFTFPGLTQIAIEANFDLDTLKANSASGAVDPARYRRVQTTHMSLDRLVGMLKANDLSKVEAIYLLHLSNQNSDEAKFKRTIQAATGCPVYVAQERGGFA